MSKLNFAVVHCTGEDLEYPVAELNTHSPHTKGWQTPRCGPHPPLCPALSPEAH